MYVGDSYIGRLLFGITRRITTPRHKQITINKYDHINIHGINHTYIQTSHSYFVFDIGLPSLQVALAQEGYSDVP